jgi:hypothetical protein
MGAGTRADLLTLERMRLSLAAVWLFVALYIATDLKLSWTTGAAFLVVGLIPPIVLFVLWDWTGPVFARRPRDPRSW